MQEIKRAITQLTKGRDFLSVPGKWTRGEFARAGNKRPVPVDSPNAVCFCAVGGMAKANGDNVSTVTYSTAYDYLGTAFATPGCLNVPDNNDKRTTTHMQVLNAFDFAILLAKDDVKQAKKQQAA